MRRGGGGDGERRNTIIGDGDACVRLSDDAEQAGGAFGGRSVVSIHLEQ